MSAHGCKVYCDLPGDLGARAHSLVKGEGFGAWRPTKEELLLRIHAEVGEVVRLAAAIEELPEWEAEW